MSRCPWHPVLLHHSLFPFWQIAQRKGTSSHTLMVCLGVLTEANQVWAWASRLGEGHMSCDLSPWLVCPTLWCWNSRRCLVTSPPPGYHLTQWNGFPRENMWAWSEGWKWRKMWSVNWLMKYAIEIGNNTDVDDNSQENCERKKWWCFRPLLCTLFRLNWAKQTPGIMRRN